jgi:hypothetical protein
VFQHPPPPLPPKVCADGGEEVDLFILQPSFGNGYKAVRIRVKKSISPYKSKICWKEGKESKPHSAVLYSPRHL